MINYLYEKARKGRDPRDETVRKDVGMMAGFVGIFLNLSLAVVKIIIALVAGSIAILADGVNNLFDTASSLVAIIGFKLASKPADKDHPYGHGRIEYVSAMIVSFLVILIGAQFIKSSIDRILNPERVLFDPVSFTLLVISVFVKLWFSKFNKVVGKRIESQTLLATSFDSMGDVITTIVVLIPMITTFFTDFQVDGYIGVLVSLMIIKNGITLMMESLSPLIGEAPSEELVEDISKDVLSYPDILGIHDIIYENRGGGKALMTMNAEMPADLTLDEAHQSIDLAERKVLEKHNILLIIHPDPVGNYTEEEKELGRKIRDVLKKRDEIITAHDFRILPDNTVFLDLEVSVKQCIDVEAYKEQIIQELEPLGDYEWNLKIIPEFE